MSALEPPVCYARGGPERRSYEVVRIYTQVRGVSCSVVKVADPEVNLSEIEPSYSNMRTNCAGRAYNKL